jgi:uncharacterized RDD family membrane protein YckC
MRGTAAYFRARETAREDEIDGQPLAPFSRRAAGFVIDFALISLLRKPAEALWARHAQYEWERHTLINIPHLLDVVVLVLYFALVLYIGNGKTIGKRLMRIQVVSLTHERITFLQALERALGYGASFLEAGFGFAQFFLQRNRQCAHDRLAETVVIDTSESALRRVDLAVVEPFTAEDGSGERDEPRQSDREEPHPPSAGVSVPDIAKIDLASGRMGLEIAASTSA